MQLQNMDQNIVDVNKAWESLNQRILNEEQMDTDELRTEGFPVYFKIAATVVLALGIILSIALTVFNRTIVYTTHANENATYILPDGSLVELGQQSKLKYSHDFNIKERKVRLSGEAFFDVVSNKNKPFYVETDLAKVLVTGTSFNVLARDNKKAEVYVKTGKVNVKALKIKENNTIVLDPGEIGMVSEKKIKIDKKVEDNYLSWKTKELVFKETQLTDVVEQLNHTFNTNIVIQDDAISQLKYTTTVKNQPLEMILKTIESSFKELKINYSKNKYSIGLKK